MQKNEKAVPACTLKDLNAAIEKCDIATLSEYVKIGFFDWVMQPEALGLSGYREPSICTYAIRLYDHKVTYYLEQAGLPRLQILNSFIELNYVPDAWNFVVNKIDKSILELGQQNARKVWVSELSDLETQLEKQFRLRYKDEQYTSKEMYQRHSRMTQVMSLVDEKQLLASKLQLIPWLAYAPDEKYRDYLSSQFAETDTEEGSGKNARAIKQFAQFFNSCELKYGFSSKQSLAYFYHHKVLSTLFMMKQNFVDNANVSYFICQTLCDGAINLNDARDMKTKFRRFFDQPSKENNLRCLPLHQISESRCKKSKT